MKAFSYDDYEAEWSAKLEAETKIISIEEKIEIMSAFARGQIVESRFWDRPFQWFVDKDPTWNWVNMRYRIKK